MLLVLAVHNRNKPTALLSRGAVQNERNIRNGLDENAGRLRNRSCAIPAAKLSSRSQRIIFEIRVPRPAAEFSSAYVLHDASASSSERREPGIGLFRRQLCQACARSEELRFADLLQERKRF